MNIATRYIGYQEIPGQTTLVYHCSGCSKKCPGCHSEEYWDKDYGTFFDPVDFVEYLDSNAPFIDCVLFMIGDVDHELVSIIYDALRIIKSYNLKTAIYTAYDCIDSVPANWLYMCDYVKVGRWIQELGGLDSETTNQTLYKKEWVGVMHEFYDWVPIVGNLNAENGLKIC